MSDAIQLNPQSTAKLLRTILRSAFPATKFSVVTERGSMVSAVRVSWTDGPTQQRVESLVAVFASGKFDGMTDGYDWKRGTDRNVIVGGQAYQTGCQYVTTSRTISPALAARAAVQVAMYFGVALPVIETYTSNGVQRWTMDSNATVAAADEYWFSLIRQAAEDASRFALQSA